MCFKLNKNLHHKIEPKAKMLEFHTTRLNVLIPIFVSTLVFIVEIYSVYHVDKEYVNWLNICRLLNTTFIPTHIATATVFLYQHFSLVNYCNNVGKMRPIDDMDVKAEYAGLTIGSTILLAFFYIIFSFKADLVNQIILFVMQCLYIWILLKYSIRDRIVIYVKTVKNVVSY